MLTSQISESNTGVISPEFIVHIDKTEMTAKSLDEFLDYNRNKRLHNDHTTAGKILEIQVTGPNYTQSVKMTEAHECCGKAYIYNFSISYRSDKKYESVSAGIIHKEIQDLREYTLKLCLVLAKHFGYTYIGYIHTSHDAIIEIGKKLGFTVAFEFTNKRTNNRLSEMYQIIK